MPSPATKFKLLVFGGSQGARIFSDVVPEALASLPNNIKKKLQLTQQVRSEDMERVTAAYEAAGITADLEPFFTDMPARISNSHLVIGRSGASTIAELSVIGRPAILVPLAHAIDNDQLLNAREFAQAGAGWIIEQSEFTPERLSGLITKLRFSEQDLASAVASSKALGRPDAAQRLADTIEKIALDSALKSVGHGPTAEDT